MKSMFKSKSIAIALAAALFLSAFSLFGVVTPTASAQSMPVTVTRNFEIRTTAASDSESFSIPSGVDVKIYVRYQRDAGQDIPLLVDVLKPNVSDPIRLTLDGNRSASQTSQTAPTINATASQTGCEPVWTVTVKTQSGGNATTRVFGSISVQWVVTSAYLMLEATKIDLPKGGAPVRKRILTIPGPGTVRIKAEWHSTALIPSYHPLRVRLFRPDGTMVKEVYGYSVHAPAEKTPKLNFTYTVKTEDARSGSALNWRLEVESNAPEGIHDFHISEIGGDFASTFTAGCGN